MKLVFGLMLSLFAATSFASSLAVECESPIGIAGVRAGGAVFRIYFSKKIGVKIEVEVPSTGATSSLPGKVYDVNHSDIDFTNVAVDMRRINDKLLVLAFENKWLFNGRVGDVAKVAVAFQDGTSRSVSCRIIE